MNFIFGFFDGEKVRLNSEGRRRNKGEDFEVTFNGEIYNSEELSRKLEKSGYSFKNNDYQGVVTAAYRIWGEECVKKFNGVFSFCIYDKEKEILFLARDHIGEKFLYYTNYNGKFIFSSQVDSIIETAQFQKEIDLRALNYFIAFRNVPDDLCIFKNIKKLLPGTLLKFDLKSGKLERRRYWEIPNSSHIGHFRPFVFLLQVLHFIENVSYFPK